MHENIAHSLGLIMAALFGSFVFFGSSAGATILLVGPQSMEEPRGLPSYPIQFLLILHDPRVL
jgi:hypothetical protein